MTELEKHVENAIASGILETIRFEGVKNEQVKLWMEVQGERGKDATWAVRVRMGDGSYWGREGIPERELLTTVKGFHGVFAKMGKERPRA